VISATAIGSIKSLANSVVRLGIGEGVSRVASFLFLAYISRHFGLKLLGIIALAQTIAMYVTLGTDQGIRLAGARLVARNGAAAPFVIKQVLVTRLLSCAVCVALGSAYALFGPVPESARLYILGFVLAVVPYAFSLDWLAWGLDKFAWLGAFRGGVTVVFVIGSILGILLTHTTLWPIVLANGVAAALGAFALWLPWRLRWKGEVPTSASSLEEVAQKELYWLTVLPLGLATILNQAFHNFDTILLGAMSSASEVGRYNSAYRILFLILGAYWLVTNALYPKLSRAKGGPGLQKVLFGLVLAVAAAGALVAAVIGIFAPVILKVVYGNDLAATGILRVLVFAIPMDFCVALLGTMFASRGLDRMLLAATGSAAVLNVLLNFFLIPKLSGMGAAIATLASYLYLLLFLLQHLIRNPIFSSQVTPATANAI
jgi:O-antigen/teichoic acid export membrane protein